MIEVCDPDADLDVLMKLIKLNTGHSVKLTKEQICQVYEDIKAGKLPLPPLIMNSSKTYLIDRKSPLRPSDYEILFSSSSKRVDIKRVAQKVGIKQTDQMTKRQMIDSIGKRLKYMKVYEPLKIGKTKTPVVTAEEFLNNTAVNIQQNNTAVNTSSNNLNSNNRNINNRLVNNNGTNINRTNNGTNINRTNNGTNINKTNNGTNINRTNNGTNINRTNNGRVNINTAKRLNTRTPINGSNKPKTRLNLPKNGLFTKEQRPFSNGRVSAVKIPQFIPSKTWDGRKNGYVFKTGNKGTGYYINDGPLRVQGPVLGPTQKPTTKNVGTSTNTPKTTTAGTGTNAPKTTTTGTGTNAPKTTTTGTGTNAPKTTTTGTGTNAQITKNIGVGNGNIKKMERNEFISKQKTKFIGMISNVKLSNNDKKALINTINDRTNLDNLKNKANKLVEQRIKEKTSKMKQNLINYITPLKISQKNRNLILNKFNSGESINILKREASQREAQLLRAAKINARSRFVANLEGLNLNSTNRNKILSKYLRGNRNTTKLLNEAKKLKAAKISQQRSANENTIKEKRRELKAYLASITSLPQNKINAFNRQINVDGTNLVKLRTEINNTVKTVKAEQREKNLNELKMYLEPLNVNKTKYINRFKQSNIPLPTIKAIINKEVSNKTLLKEKQKTLSEKINGARKFGVAFNYNTGVNTLNTNNKISELNRRVDITIKSIVNKGRNSLSNKIIDAKIKNDFMNKVTAVKTLQELRNVEREINSAILTKEENNNKKIAEYMKKLGLNNTDIDSVVRSKLSLENSIKKANEIAKNKIRLSLTKKLDEMKIAVRDRNQFYNALNQGMSIRNIESFIQDYVRIREQRKSVNDIAIILNKYNLTNEDREEIMANWNMYQNMTVLNVKKLANNRSQAFKKEKGVALRKYLTDDLRLSQNDIEKIMANFNTNSRNMESLRQKAQLFKELSGERRRLTGRISKAKINGININLNTNITSLENVRSINNKINKAYISKNKKNLSRRALDYNINISTELNNASSANNIIKLRNKLNKVVKGKQKENLIKLETAIRELNNKNKERFLQKFKNQDGKLENILSDVKSFKNTLLKQKIEKEKQELIKYVSESLRLGVEDRDAVMATFNTTKNFAGSKSKANTLRKQRNNEKIASDRKKLESKLQTMNLDNSDRKSILGNFNRKPGNIESFEAGAKLLIEKRAAEKRANERRQLDRYVSNLGLDGQNRNSIMTTFNKSKNKSLNSAKSNAKTLKEIRDKNILEKALKNLPDISLTEKEQLRKNLKGGGNLKKIIASAKSINSSTKTKKLSRNLKAKLDGLRSLTLDQKTKLMAKITGPFTDVERIKREAVRINTQMKNQAKIAKNRSDRALKNTTQNEENAQKIMANITNKQDNFLKEQDIQRELRKKEIKNIITIINSSKLPKPTKNGYIKQVKGVGANLKSLRNLLIRDIEFDNKKTGVTTTVKSKLGPLYRLSKWKTIVNDAKTVKALTAIDEDFRSRVELEGEIKRSKVPSRGDLLSKVMRSDTKVKTLRNRFEKELSRNVVKRQLNAANNILKLAEKAQKAKTVNKEIIELRKKYKAAVEKAIKEGKLRTGRNANGNPIFGGSNLRKYSQNRVQHNVFLKLANVIETKEGYELYMKNLENYIAANAKRLTNLKK